MFVYQALGIREEVSVKGAQLGIECETEGRRLPEMSPPGWRWEHDGSLRNGAEYVTQGSVAIEDVKESLKVLHTFIKASGGTVNYSFRCSTHVHVNVQDLDEKKVLNMIFLYMMFENVFMNYVDKSRVGNRFCLRFQDAQLLTHTVCQFIRDMNSRRNVEAGIGLSAAMTGLSQNELKYAALNLYTLRKYGTLEFRALEGTNNVDKIHGWCQAIVKLREVACRFQDAKELYEEFMQNPRQLAEELFGHAKEQFLKPGWQQQVEEGYSQNQAVLMVL